MKKAKLQVMAIVIALVAAWIYEKSSIESDLLAPITSTALPSIQNENSEPNRPSFIKQTAAPNLAILTPGVRKRSQNASPEEGDKYTQDIYLDATRQVGQKEEIDEMRSLTKSFFNQTYTAESSELEQKIQSALVADRPNNNLDALSVQCRSDICEIKVRTYGGNPEAAWSEFLSKAHDSAWWNSIEAERSLVSTTGTQATLISYLVTKQQ